MKRRIVIASTHPTREQTRKMLRISKKHARWLDGIVHNEARMISAKHRGTFGGCKAGDLLDELLCRLNIPKLIPAVAKILSAWSNKRNKIIKGTTDLELRCDVLCLYKAIYLEKVNKLDLSPFRLHQEDEYIIKSWMCNIIVTTYRQIVRDCLTGR